MYCLPTSVQSGGSKTKKLSHRASRNKHKNTCTFLMVLCNSQREEGFILSQICRTSNRAIPQNYKINLEPIFNFLCLFYWIIVEKTSVRNCAKKCFLLRCKLRRSWFLSFHLWTIRPEVAFTKTFRMNEQPSSQDDVLRGLGMLPQQANEQK